MAENAQTFLFTSTLLQTTVAICKTSQAIWGQNQIEKLAKSFDMMNTVEPCILEQIDNLWGLAVAKPMI